MVYDKLKTLRDMNVEYYEDIIIELGLLKKQNICALCFTEINIKGEYHIQLCSLCREETLDRYGKEIMNNGGSQ